MSEPGSAVIRVDLRVGLRAPMVSSLLDSALPPADTAASHGACPNDEDEPTP